MQATKITVLSMFMLFSSFYMEQFIIKTVRRDSEAGTNYNNDYVYNVDYADNTGW